jgi:hypothetical protein
VLRLIPDRSTNGLTVWRPADVLWPVACPPPGQDRKALVGARAGTDWPDGGFDLIVIRRVTLVPPLAGRPQ